MLKERIVFHENNLGRRGSIFVLLLKVEFHTPIIRRGNNRNLGMAFDLSQIFVGLIQNNIGLILPTLSILLFTTYASRVRNQSFTLCVEN